MFQSFQKQYSVSAFHSFSSSSISFDGKEEVIPAHAAD